MGAFEYTALDARGKQRKGVLEGDTPKQIRQKLRDKGYSPLNVEAVQQKEAKRNQQKLSFQRGVSAGDLALLTRQFATLVRSGTPIDESLKAVSEQTEKARLSSMMLGVRARVLEGKTLASAMDDYPHVFPDLFRATVSAGEQSSHLDVVLERLADYTESRQILAQKTMTALIYPAFLVFAAFGIVIVLLAYVVPKVITVFDNLGQELPLITQLLIALSAWIREYGLFAGIGIIIIIAVFRWMLRGEKVKHQYHRALLKLPVIGRMIRSLNSARFARTFSIVTASGVPVLEGLHISAKVLTCLPMKKAVDEAAAMVREGAGISKSLATSRYFPPMTIHLIASGEASGDLEGMLERAAESQEREVETMISAVLGIFEPVLLLAMGGVVLLIVLAILLPIFEMNQLVG